MKRLLSTALFLFLVVQLSAQGMLYLQNFTAEDYKAHNINFDIKTGKDGTIYAANFEGLLYYDHAAWSILHTSGITRVTTTYRDKNNVIWAGGYNYFGRIEEA